MSAVVQRRDLADLDLTESASLAAIATAEIVGAVLAEYRRRGIGRGVLSMAEAATVRLTETRRPSAAPHAPVRR